MIGRSILPKKSIDNMERKVGDVLAKITHTAIQHRKEEKASARRWLMLTTRGAIRRFLNLQSTRWDMQSEAREGNNSIRVDFREVMPFSTDEELWDIFMSFSEIKLKMKQEQNLHLSLDRIFEDDKYVLTIRWPNTVENINKK